MLRVTLLFALLGVAHCVMWGIHHHHSEPYSSDSGPDSSDSGPDSNDSGPDSRDSGPDSRDSGPDSRDSRPDSRDSGPDSNDSGPDSSDSGPDSNDSASCGPGGHHIHSHTWHWEHDRRFQKLSDYIIRADRYSKNLCDRYTPNNVQELHNFAYTLIYTMPQMDPNNIAVKIKHRVLYMYARQSDSKDSPTYVDVKVLPDTLKTSDAIWTYSEDKLTIVIPYDTDLTTKIVKKCFDVNVDIKDVKTEPQKSEIILYKFGP